MPEEQSGIAPASILTEMLADVEERIKTLEGSRALLRAQLTRALNKEGRVSCTVEKPDGRVYTARLTHYPPKLVASYEARRANELREILRSLGLESQVFSAFDADAFVRVVDGLMKLNGGEIPEGLRPYAHIKEAKEVLRLLRPNRSEE